MKQNKLLKIGFALLVITLFILGSVSTANAISDEWDGARIGSQMIDDEYDPMGEPVDEPRTEPIKGGITPDPEDPK